MKKSYETLRIEVVTLDVIDILTVSSNTNGFYGDEHEFDAPTGN